MRHSLCRFLATGSLGLLAAALAAAATRPRYGGALRVEMRASVAALDPAVQAATDAEAGAKERMEKLLFDRLVRLDEDGRPRPQLALSWSHDAENKKWQFRWREGVKLPNGSTLGLQDAATSLAAANPDWRVTVLGGSLEIETHSPLPGLPAELARAPYSIVHRLEDGSFLGSGPFRLSAWQPGRRAVLVANDDYWGGRPYLDSVEIEMGRAPREQFIDLELGKAHVIEVGLDQLRRASQENLGTALSRPAELMAILFPPGRPAADDARLREALALSIDRATMHTILLQRQGEPAGGLLPEWLSGYAFLFPAVSDPARTRELRAELSSAPAVTLSYDAADALARAIAERIALNARDAGIILRVSAEDSAAPGSDARLVRMKLASTDLRAALAAMAESLHEPAAKLRAESALPDEFYAIERGLLADFRVIPLFHLPEAFGLSSRVRDWSLPAQAGRAREGGWRLEAVWLEVVDSRLRGNDTEKP